MNGINTTALFGNFDVNSVVSSLMEIERVPLSKLQQQRQTIEAKISAWGSMKSTLDSLRTTLSKNPENTKNISINGDSVDAKGSVPPGTTNIQVHSLSKSQTLVSERIESRNAVLTTEVSNLHISIGEISGGTLSGGKWSGATFVVNKSGAASIKSGATIDDIANAINESKMGISAAVMFDGTGWRLSINGETGRKSSFSATVNGDASLSDFITHVPTGEQRLTETMSAKDATFSINGLEMTRTGNAVNDVYESLSITLKKEGASELKMGASGNEVLDYAKEMVSVWNKTMAEMRAMTGKNGKMQGEQSLVRLENDLRKTVSKMYESDGGLARISQIGIELDKQGQMKIDVNRISESGDAAISLLKSFGNGAATLLSDFIDGSSAATKEDILNSKMDAISKQEETMTRRLEIIRKNYVNQYSLLNGYLNSASGMYGIVQGLNK